MATFGPPRTTAGDSPPPETGWQVGGPWSSAHPLDSLLLRSGLVIHKPHEEIEANSVQAAVRIGTRFAQQPLELSLPLLVAGMNFGALSASAKEALARAALRAGIASGTGDGGLTDEELATGCRMVYQCTPSRDGFRPADLRRAAAIELVLEHAGGYLPAPLVSSRVGQLRCWPAGRARPAVEHHPDWDSRKELAIKLEQLREVTAGAIPILIKCGSSRIVETIHVAAEAGADAVVLETREAGFAHARASDLHVGLPTLLAVRLAVTTLRQLGLHRQMQLICAGGVRHAADVAKLLALGADAVMVGRSVLRALAGLDPHGSQDGAEATFFSGLRIGSCAYGIFTQRLQQEERLDPVSAADRVAQYLEQLGADLRRLTGRIGKQGVRELSRADLVALNKEAAELSGVMWAGEL